MNTKRKRFKLLVILLWIITILGWLFLMSEMFFYRSTHKWMLDLFILAISILTWYVSHVYASFREDKLFFNDRGGKGVLAVKRPKDYILDSIDKMLEEPGTTYDKKKPAYPRSIKELNLGYVNYVANEEMKKGIPDNILAEVFFNQAILDTIEDKKHVEKIYLTRKVTAKLTGNDKFEITPLSTATQIVLDDEKTTWHWEVKPVKSGKGMLTLTISAAIGSVFGFETKDIETYSKNITIRINPLYTIKIFLNKNWQWILGTIFGSGVLIVILKAFNIISK